MYSFHYNEIAEGRNVASCKSLKMHHFPAGDVKLVLEWADGGRAYCLFDYPSEAIRWARDIGFEPCKGK